MRTDERSCGKGGGARGVALGPEAAGLAGEVRPTGARWLRRTGRARRRAGSRGLLALVDSQRLGVRGEPAGIIGTQRSYTAWMISVLSMPRR
jgi:hypothetical protein